MAPRLSRMPQLLLRTSKALQDKHFATAPAAASIAAAAAAAAPYQTGAGAVVHACHRANAVHHHNGSPATFVAGLRSFTVSSSTNGSAGSSGASDGSSGGSGGGGSGGGIVELRCYTLKADGVGPYLKATGEFAALRRQLSPGWMGFWTTETGGKLTEVKHLYRYEGGWEHRDAVRSSIASSKEWNTAYLPLVRPHVASMESMILAEASDCMAAAAPPPPAAVAAGDAHSPTSSDAATPQSPSLYELRRYELVAGYHSMPILRQHMVKGLPSRVAAQGRGRCVFMGFSDVGLLNVFLELWRYDGTTDCTLARQGARAAEEWRKSIAGIAEVTQSFRTEYLRPTKFSPLQ